MASPRYVYPWWGRNMVDDPEKHIHQTGQYKKPDPWGREQPRVKEQKKRKKHSLQITLITVQHASLSDDSAAV